jgi:hypothetical protein
MGLKSRFVFGEGRFPLFWTLIDNGVVRVVISEIAPFPVPGKDLRF